MQVAAALDKKNPGTPDRGQTPSLDGAREPRTQPVAACPTCDSESIRSAFAIPDRLHGTPGTFSYSRCLRCGTVFQAPRVIGEDLALCYPGEYYTHSASAAIPAGLSSGEVAQSPGGLRGALRSLRGAVRARILGQLTRGIAGALAGALAGSRRVRERLFDGLIDELIPHRGVGKRAVDIGCGSGQLVALLGKAGWDAQGVEWDPAAAKTAATVTGRSIQAGDFRELPLDVGGYDLVVLSHVFEHLEDPAGALRRIAELLTPDGRAVLIYPNPQSLGARWFGPAWYPWDAPRHLVLPPAAGLARCAASLQLRVYSVRTLIRGRWAVINCANSRAYRVGKNAGTEDVSTADRVVVMLAALATAVGLPLGDEVVIEIGLDP